MGRRKFYRDTFLTSPIFKACVFGNPIEQSKSPIIHAAFAKQFGIELEYTKRFAEPDAFVQSVTEFFADPACQGANVTMPFKHDACQWVDSLSPQAEHAGAVNTIIRKNGQFIGDNTDGYGLTTDLLAHNVLLKNARVLLIGAGGAAKGAMPALIDADVASVSIYNRSISKAEDLVRDTHQYKAGVACLYKDGDANFDIIINATSLSLQGKLPEISKAVFSQHPAVYDMVYLSEPTVFLAYAETQGAKVTIDGLGMLVHQAARSFYLWFNKKPDTQAIYEHLRSLAVR